MDETKQNFREWVNAGLDLVKPWKIALIATNAFWALILALFIFFAYMTPDTSYQYQDFDEHIQTQADGEYDPSMAPTVTE